MGFVKEAKKRTDEIAKRWIKSGRKFDSSGNKYAKDRIKDTERFIKGRE